MIKPSPRAPRRDNPLLRRLASSLLIASVGVAIGFGYAQYSLTPEEMATRLPGLYASLGAAVAILGARLGGLLLRIVRDLFG